MTTTDRLLYEEVLRLRKECDHLRNLNRQYGEMMGEMMVERNSALRDVQFARSEVVRLSEIVTKQQGLIRNAEEARERAEGTVITQTFTGLLTYELAEKVAASIAPKPAAKPPTWCGDCLRHPRLHGPDLQDLVKSPLEVRLTRNSAIVGR